MEFKRIGIFLGNAYEWKKQYVEKVRIPPVTQDNLETVHQIESLVGKIISIKKQNPQEDTSAYEREIDQLVYKLYELTDEEIEIIERGKVDG
jgi:type II restriction/modification system DNA methylase subunit YeeA